MSEIANKVQPSFRIGLNNPLDQFTEDKRSVFQITVPSSAFFQDVIWIEFIGGWDGVGR